MKVLFKFSLILAVLSAMSCASTYKTLNPESFAYQNSYEIRDTMRVSYLYGAQALTGNKRYDKRERRYGMASVAVKIENLLDTSMVLTRNNFKVYANGQARPIYSPEAYSQKVKQWGAVHLLHSLWGPWAISWEEDEYGETDVSFIYIPVGAIVGIANAVKATNANKENLANQKRYEIWNEKIVAGGTLYGLISIPSLTRDSLAFVYGHSSIPRKTSAGSSYVLPKGPVSLKHDFYVIMKDGMTYSIQTKISANGEEYFIKADNPNLPPVIKPSDTKTLSRLTAESRQLLGIPDGNRWLFKIIEGRIDGYYFLAEENTTVFSNLQKDNGPIVAFSPATLEEMIDGDPEILILIQKKNFVEAITRYNQKYKE